MKFTRADIAAIGIFSGLAYAGGFLFIAVPNVEIFTAAIFLSGVLLGPRNGLVVGVVGATLYAIFNPFGVSPAPLFVAQVFSRAIIGLVGGILRSLLDFDKVSWYNAFWLGLVGLLLTWGYDLLADLSFFLVSGFSLQQIKIALFGALPFYLVHGVVNTAIFALVLPSLIRRMLKTNVLKMANLG